jgi:hypothetical protein
MHAMFSTLYLTRCRWVYNFVANKSVIITDQHYARSYITPLFDTQALHVSASMCHLQRASYVLVNYLKAEMFVVCHVL